MYKAPKLKENTQIVFKSRLKTHIYPAFGEQYLDEITTTDIQEFLNERKHLSKSTLDDLKNYLSQIFKGAMDEGLITTDPTDSKRLFNPSSKVEERKTLTDIQVADIIRNIPKLTNKNDRMLMAFLMFTGMRPSEIYGLQWENIDRENMLIHVRHALVFASNKSIFKDTKTQSGKRDIPLDPMLINYLEPFGESGFIFVRGKKYGHEGEPITQQAHKRAWERIKGTINVYGMVPYEARHTYLTALNNAGADAKSLQTIAGHANIKTTLTNYVHSSPEQIQKVGNMMHGRYEKMVAM